MKSRRVRASFVMLIMLGAMAQVGGSSVRHLTDSAGAVTDSYEYDAYGNEVASTGSTPNAYLYRGERYGADLGLYYLRARWYNPVTRRFMTRDPYQGSIYDPASLHRYNYARAGHALRLLNPDLKAVLAPQLFKVTDLLVRQRN